MAKGELSALHDMAKADANFKRDPEMYEFYVAAKLDGWKIETHVRWQSPVPDLTASGCRRAADTFLACTAPREG